MPVLEDSAQLGSERGPPSCLLVLEVEKDVLPVRGGILDATRRVEQILVTIVRLAEPEVAKICGDFDGYGPFRTLDSAERDVEAAQAFVDLVDQPALVPEFETDPEIGRELVKEVFETRHVPFQERRELKEQRPEFVLERASVLAKVAGKISRVT